jgi:DnaJ-class molecular chaperone
MSFKKVLMLVCLSIFVTGFASAQTFSYIGAMKCKMCHNTEKSGYQYKIWSESLHAKSMASLSNQKSLDYAKANGIADPTKDQKCLKCHSTAASVDQNLVETITVAEGVSCESCHGPGSAYKTNTIMKDRALALKNGMIIPDQKTCEKCHNKENPFYKPFDFAAASKKIAHPTPPAP